MGRAMNMLRHAAHYGRESFSAGLKAAGYNVVEAIPDPRAGDALLLWNRKPKHADLANEFEARGATVFVAENPYLPERLIGPGWYALAEGHHCGAGRWPKGGPERWDTLGVELKPWQEGTETLVLDQNAGGIPGIASPKNWAETTQARIGGRVRLHPWKKPDQPPIEEDLADVRQVVTWSSSAALIALVMGVPVFYEMKRWIGGGAGRHIDEFGQEPKRDDADRLAMFRRLAWAIWRKPEIEDGSAFKALAAVRK